MIDLQNVGFQYKDKDERSIHGISCAIEKGEVVVLAGESGCGKSTLLRSLNGLCPHFYEGQPTGTLLLAGKDCRTLRIGDISRLAATVFQNPDNQLFTLDVLSDLVFAAENFPPRSSAGCAMSRRCCAWSASSGVASRNFRAAKSSASPLLRR